MDQLKNIIKMVWSFINVQLRLLYNVIMNPSLFHPKELLNWHFGIFTLIVILIIIGLL
jgi:heme/copper-type cytochrome/quinol oxidase subunit 4